MALTATERAKVRMWLGYPDPLRYPISYGQMFISSLEEAMTAISPETEELVRKTLERLDKIEDQIFGTDEGGGALAEAGVKRVDEIEFFDSKLPMLLKDNKIAALIDRLAALLGVPKYSACNLGSSNMIPLG